MIKLIFLDIDGVLNRHAERSNGYCGMVPELVDNLNIILKRVPEAQIVLTSAWRYCVHKGWCTLRGLEHLLLTHGVDCAGRIHGITDPDDESGGSHEPPFDVDYWAARGLRFRAEQIGAYLKPIFLNECVGKKNSLTSVIIDDLPLDSSGLVKTDPKIGLTREDAEKAIEILNRLELTAVPRKIVTMRSLSPLSLWVTPTHREQFPDDDLGAIEHALRSSGLTDVKVELHQCQFRKNGILRTYLMPDWIVNLIQGDGFKIHLTSLVIDFVEEVVY